MGSRSVCDFGTCKNNAAAHLAAKHVLNPFFFPSPLFFLLCFQLCRGICLGTVIHKSCFPTLSQFVFRNFSRDYDSQIVFSGFASDFVIEFVLGLWFTIQVTTQRNDKLMMPGPIFPLPIFFSPFVCPFSFPLFIFLFSVSFFFLTISLCLFYLLFSLHCFVLFKFFFALSISFPPSISPFLPVSI